MHPNEMAKVDIHSRAKNVPTREGIPGSKEVVPWPAANAEMSSATLSARAPLATTFPNDVSNCTIGVKGEMAGVIPPPRP